MSALGKVNEEEGGEDARQKDALSELTAGAGRNEVLKKKMFTR